MEKLRKAGLLILTRIPNMGIVGVSQTRGIYDVKNLRPLSFPSVSQVTVYGKCKKDENFPDTILREAKEELGEKASDIILPKKWREKFNAQTVYSYSSVYLEIEIIAIFIEDHTFLQEIRAEPSSGEIRLIFQRQLSSIRQLGESDKSVGMLHFPRTKLGMTMDTYTAFLQAFEIFGK